MLNGLLSFPHSLVSVCVLYSIALTGFQRRRVSNKSNSRRAMGGLRSMRAQELQCGGGACVRVQVNSCVGDYSRQVG